MSDQKLSDKYPFLTVENKTGSEETIMYGNGDTVTVRPGVKRKLSTVGLNQIPNMTAFKFENPTVHQLIEDGFIEVEKVGGTTEAKVAPDNDGPAVEASDDSGETIAEDARELVDAYTETNPGSPDSKKDAAPGSTTSRRTSR